MSDAKENSFIKNKSTTKPHRVFTTKDPLLDKIYHEVDLLMSKTFMENKRSFDYKFENNTHTLQVNSNKKIVKFIKKDNEDKISVQELGPDERWVKISNSPEKDYTNEFYAQASGYQIMWPINKGGAFLQDENLDKMRFLSHSFNEKLNNLKKSHPEYKDDISFITFTTSKKNEEEIKLIEQRKKRINQAHIVLIKKWQKKLKRKNIIEKKMMTKLWWNHFVDRDVFKLWASVIGVSKKKSLTWLTYAQFTNQPELKNIVKNVNELGLERMFLLRFPWEKWSVLKTKDIVPKSWNKVWHKVTPLPASAQKTILRVVDDFILNQTHDNDIRFLNNDMASVGNFNVSLETFNKKDMEKDKVAFWSLMDNLQAEIKQKKYKISKREMDVMVLALLNSSEYISHEKYDKFLKKNGGMVENMESFIPSLIYPLVKSWREVESDDYRRWGESHKSKFISISSFILKASIKAGNMNFNVEDNYDNYYIDSIKKMKIVHDKNEITSEISESKTHKLAKTKKRLI